MSNKEQKDKVQKEINSFKGAPNIRVTQPELKKSFNGAYGLKPTPTPAQKPAPQPTPPSSQKGDAGKKQ